MKKMTKTILVSSLALAAGWIVPRLLPRVRARQVAGAGASARRGTARRHGRRRMTNEREGMSGNAD